MNVHVTIFHKNFLKFSCINLSVTDRGSLSVRSLRGLIAEHEVLPLVLSELSLSLAVCCRNEKTRGERMVSSRKTRVFHPLVTVEGDPHWCLYSQGLEKHRNCRFLLLLLLSPLSPKFGNFRFYVVSELCLRRWPVINRKFFTSVWLFCVWYIKDVKVFQLLGSVPGLLMSRARAERSNVWKQRGIVKLSGLFFMRHFVAKPIFSFWLNLSSHY